MFKRELDELGRITLPIEFRKKLEVKEKDVLKIEIKENKVIITKDKDACFICGFEYELISIKNYFVCSHCLEILNTQKGGTVIY